MSQLPTHTEELPEVVRLAFESRPHISMGDLAKVLKMNMKTLRTHINAGDIDWHQKGLGSKRPHRVFTLSDAVEFYKCIVRRRGEVCDFTNSPERPIDGRQIRKSTKAPNKAEAKIIAAREIEQLKRVARQALAIGHEPMTFKLVAEVWWERRMAHGNEADLLVGRTGVPPSSGPKR
jgi:hypothetical protein